MLMAPAVPLRPKGYQPAQIPGQGRDRFNIVESNGSNSDSYMFPVQGIFARQQTPMSLGPS